MWNFQSKRSLLHERLLLAPETNPSEFVRRYLAQNPKTNRTAAASQCVVDGGMPSQRAGSGKALASETSNVARYGSD